jgi:hypothetical protein
MADMFSFLRASTAGLDSPASCLKLACAICFFSLQHLSGNMPLQLQEKRFQLPTSQNLMGWLNWPALTT